MAEGTVTIIVVDVGVCALLAIIYLCWRHRRRKEPIFMDLRRRLVVKVETFRYGGARLYHQTDDATAKIILETQQMRPGNGGVAGGGIYFATTPELTGHKAHKKGVILEATVALGKIHTLDAAGDPNMTLQKLKSMGFDSVCIARAVSSGHEYVVYDPGQVQRIIRDLSFKLDGTEWTAGYAWHGWLGKRHQHANRLGGQWAKRYFSVDEARGTFSYAKNEVARPKVVLPLCDVAKVTVSP